MTWIGVKAENTARDYARTRIPASEAAATKAVRASSGLRFPSMTAVQTTSAWSSADPSSSGQSSISAQAAACRVLMAVSTSGSPMVMMTGVFQERFMAHLKAHRASAVQRFCNDGTRNIKDLQHGSESGLKLPDE